MHGGFYKIMKSIPMLQHGIFHTNTGKSALYYKRYLWTKAIITLIASLLLVSTCTAIGSQPTTDVQLKAAFVYNFIKFVEWPADTFPNTNSPITIGVLGDDSFANTLSATVKDKTVGGRKIAIKQSMKARDIEGCQLVYIGSNNESHLSKTIEDIGNHHTLTVSDIEGFARRGGIIGFTDENDKLAIEINLRKAKESDLKISSKLLKLAHIID